jgi:hypothetical protein
MGEAIARARSSRLGRAPCTEEIAGFVDPPSSGGTYLRSVFEEVGLFDESFDACAGVEFNERVRQAGIRAYSDPRLTVCEQPPQKLRGLLREMFRYGRGASHFMRKHPDCSSVADIAPLVAVLIASMQIGASYGFRCAWRAPGVFATVYLGQGIGLLYEYAFPTGSGWRKKVAPVVTVPRPGESRSQADRAA